MKLIKTKIKDLLIIKTNIYNDNRGFFKEIEKQSLFYFMYNNSHINVKRKVSLYVKEQTIYQILF